MLSITKYLLDVKQVQTIETRSISKVLTVRIENERSKPEIYILEDLESPVMTKSFLVCQEAFQLDHYIGDLSFIGMYDIREGLHKFWVFEILDTHLLRAPSNTLSFRSGVQGSQGSQGSYTNTAIYSPNLRNTANPSTLMLPSHQVPEEKPIPKYARVPKPDKNVVYSLEQLKAMDSQRQLKPLTVLYGLKGRTKNQLSKENQIKFILSCQEGTPLDADVLVRSQANYTSRRSLSYKDPEPSFSESSKTPPVLVMTSPHDPQI